MQTDASADAPADALKFVKNIFRTRAAEPKPSILRRFVAALQIDLASGEAAFGERSAGSAEARQMLFDAGDNAVDLRVKHAADGFEIAGQVLGDGFENADVELKGIEINGVAKTTEMSMFKFAGLPAGDYKLTIRSSEAEIVIEKVRIS